MARIQLMQQSAVFQNEAKYEIGLAISNNDLINLENGLINASGILLNYNPNETNLNARAVLKGFLENIDQYKIWKEIYLKENNFNPIPSSMFLKLPDNECNIQLGIKTDNEKPSQMMLFSIDEVKYIASALRLAYDLADDYNLMDAINSFSGLLEGFESFINAVENGK